MPPRWVAARCRRYVTGEDPISFMDTRGTIIGTDRHSPPRFLVRLIQSLSDSSTAVIVAEGGEHASGGVW